MYYNLTKKEYKEFEKKFNKTYIGRQLYIGVITSLIFGCILFAIAGYDIGYRAVEAFEITLLDIALFMVGGFSLIENVLKQAEYRRELKQYILEKNKN